MNNSQFNIVVNNLAKNLIKEIRHEVVEFKEVAGKFQSVGLKNNQNNFLNNPIINEVPMEVLNLFKVEDSDMDRAAIFAVQLLKEAGLNVEFVVEGNYWHVGWEADSVAMVDSVAVKIS